eukprot:6192031-Pleurochrysis_carterae.AAC.1
MRLAVGSRAERVKFCKYTPHCSSDSYSAQTRASLVRHVQRSKGSCAAEQGPMARRFVACKMPSYVTRHMSNLFAMSSACGFQSGARSRGA